MQNKDVKKSVSNPIPAKQIVDVQVNWDCLTAPTCTTLELSLQTIIDEICVIKDLEELEISCFEVESITLFNVLQGIITKLCSVEQTSTTNDITETLDLSNINNCTPDTWDCNSANNCIVVTNPCGPEATNEEIIQALYSRVVKQSEVIKDLCTRLDELESRLNTAELELDNGCCDSQSLINQINTINTQLNTINTNCC